MAEVLSHTAARAKYWRRQAIVEPCFAELRERQGLRRFRRRGLNAVRAEFALHCIAFNAKRAVGHSVLLIVCLLRRVGSGTLRTSLSAAPQSAAKSARGTLFYRQSQAKQGIILQKQANFATYSQGYFPKPVSQPEMGLWVDPRLDVNRPA